MLSITPFPQREGLVLHLDNAVPMTGVIMLAILLRSLSFG